MQHKNSLRLTVAAITVLVACAIAGVSYVRAQGSASHSRSHHHGKSQAKIKK